MPHTLEEVSQIHNTMEISFIATNAQNNNLTSYTLTESVEREKNKTKHQPRILYPGKLSLKREGEIKTCSVYYCNNLVNISKRNKAKESHTL